MNRRTLVASTIAFLTGGLLPKLGVEVFAKKQDGGITGKSWPSPPPAEPVKGVPYRSGMRLHFTGRPPEHGRFAAHSISLSPGCIRDVDTGENVTNIQSLVISLSGNAWMDAVVTTVDRDASMTAHRLVRRRDHSPLSLDLVVRSESVADHAERVRLMGNALKLADQMADHVAIDEWGAATDYRKARKALDELGGIA